MKNTTIKFKEILKISFSLLRSNRNIHIMNIILWLLISIIPLLIGILLKNMLDSLDTSKSSYFLNLFILFIVAMLNILFIYVGGILDIKSRFYVGKQLRSNLFNYFLLQDNKVNTATILNIFNSDVNIIEEFISFSMDLFNRIIYFIFAIYILGRINMSMTFIVFLPLLLVMLFVYSLGDKIKKHYNSAKSEDVETLTFISSMILSHNSIRYFANSSTLLTRFSSILKKRKNENIKKAFFYDIVEKLVELISYIANVVIMVSAIYFLPLQSDIGTFTLFIEYITYGGAYILIFQEVFINYQSILKFIDNISNSMKISSESFTQFLVNNNELTKIDIDFPITFNDFKFIENNKTLNFKINRGDILHITGQIGVGKSKLIDCLLGQHKYSGNIYVGDNNIDMAQLGSISYVGQDVRLFDDTITNNITLYAELDLLRLEQILSISELNDRVLIDYVNNKTNIGVDGKLLSEGQRQRLAIARGLYVNSELIILDECFTNIDRINKIKIMDNIIKLNKTIIIVSSDKDIVEILEGSMKIVLQRNC